MRAKVSFIATLLCFFTFATPSASADTDPGDKKVTDKQLTKQEFKEAVEVLKERVQNLKEAKKNAQTQEEKQTIKEDIKDVKKEAKELKEQQGGGFGIYIGGGALLVIILLILLL